MAQIGEDETFWRGFLATLKQRGLHGVKLVISDQHAGPVKALKRSFQGAGHQRCRVHFARNLLAHVPKSHVHPSWDGRRSVPPRVRTTRRRRGRPAWDEVRDQLTKSFPKIGPLMDEAKAEVLAFATFPRAHHLKAHHPTGLFRSLTA
ncbi:transposase [Nocardioides sp. SLBN-35]|uniref:transposase n=1 Tax=Nocardioides sp. SLBN-35 TaxID=2768445 RepID=UPI0037C730B0